MADSPAETLPVTAGPIVTSVDGEEFTTPHARTLSKRMFWAGCGLLPWFWAVNFWLFWPSFRHGQDAVIQQCTRRSAALFAAWLLPFLAWMLVFMAGGPGVVGQPAYDKLDVTRLNLAQYGLA